MFGVAAGGVGGHPVILGFQFLPVKDSAKTNLEVALLWTMRAVISSFLARSVCTLNRV